LGDAVLRRLKNLLGVFVAAVLYFVTVQHLTNLYATEHHGVERFILLDGGIYTQLFWIGQVALGGIIPLVLLYHPVSGATRLGIILASTLVLLGGLAQIYVIIIGGQAYPLVLFPGMEITSSWFDGQIHAYVPSLPEIALGLSGVAIALLITAVAVKVLPFLPLSLADADIDPHFTPTEEKSSPVADVEGAKAA
ncbi:MAG: polysulfide reductase NrfD, partial [Rhodospirillales bacterium]|nr:polysulfide reductase NrfD [Rhodospirillales bacterium]